MDNKNRTIIGTFVKKNGILSFFEKMKYLMRLSIDKSHVYEIDGNDKEYLVTFIVLDKDKYVKMLDNFTVLHTKNGCIFSINALNTLIKTEKEKQGLDIPNDEYVIDWNLYSNKLIILTNGKLSLSDVKMVDDKCVFLK